MRLFSPPLIILYVVAIGFAGRVIWAFVRGTSRRYVFNYRRRWERAAAHAVGVLQQRYPGSVPQALGRLYILSPGSGMLWIVIDGDLAARVQQYTFDVALPEWAMRPLGRERAEVCRTYVGEPKAEAFTAFLNAHLGADDGRVLPADLRTLADMQGAIWAAFYEAGWPVMCPKTCFADAAAMEKMFPLQVSA